MTLTGPKTLNISIIIPTLNEAKVLGKTLSSLKKWTSLEIIVADGGSVDQTVSLAKKSGARVISCLSGRGVQLNRGAEVASHEILLFLHCDTILPEDFQSHIDDILSQTDNVAGAFQLTIDNPAIIYRLIEWGVRFRSANLKMIYGDQAIFVNRELFFKIGGFPEQPLLEDVTLIKKLKRQGQVAIAPASVSTSARRWESKGVLKTTLINQLILMGYFSGISPEKLARFYY